MLVLKETKVVCGRRSLLGVRLKKSYENQSYSWLYALWAVVLLGHVVHSRLLLEDAYLASAQPSAA